MPNGSASFLTPCLLFTLSSHLGSILYFSAFHIPCLVSQPICRLWGQNISPPATPNINMETCPPSYFTRITGAIAQLNLPTSSLILSSLSITKLPVWYCSNQCQIYPSLRFSTKKKTKRFSTGCSMACRVQVLSQPFYKTLCSPTPPNLQPCLWLHLLLCRSLFPLKPH